MRISGLASGLDIDQIVKDLMKAKRVPLDKLIQKKTTFEWQQEQYRDVNIKLVNFRNNKLFNYGMSGSMDAKKVNITGNTTAVSARALTGAVGGAIVVDVTNIATAAQVRSSNPAIGPVDTSQTLSALKAAGQITYTADGSGNVSFTITNGGSTGTITVNETDTMASVVTAINSNTSANVNAFLDSSTGKMSLTSKATGAGSITFSANLLSSFNMSVSTAGTDASLNINGINTTRTSNTFTENGVEITLNAPTGATAASLNIVTDTDKIVDTIKSFIADYNDVLGTVNTKLNEQRYRTYVPLSDEKKTDMKDKDVELWEEKAKSGLLRRDTTLTKMTDDIRLASITAVTVGGQPVELASLGITTGAWYERGELVIQDEAKLRAAIEANPDQVVKFFTQPTAETDPTLRVSASNPDNGLFNRLSNVVMTALNDLSEKAGTNRFSTDTNAEFDPSSTIGEQLRSLQMSMDQMKNRLNLIEDGYYKKFTAMETAMNRLNAQGSSLFGASQ